MGLDHLRLRNQICFRLYTASRLVTQAYYPLLENLGITYPQYLVLMALWEKDGQKIMELAHLLYLDSNTMTPLVKRMEKEGIVNRVKGKKDGRETYVYLTKKGKEMEVKADGIPMCMVGKILDDPTQLSELKAIGMELDRIIDRLSTQKQIEKLKEEDEEFRLLSESSDPLRIKK